MYTNAVDNIKNSNHYIKYRFDLNSKYGCKNTALIVEQLEFWFSKNDYYNGFYKFIEPCDHHFYKENDSWTEILSISRSTFIRCFNKIGVRYKSKTQFLETHDKFQGKPYAYYYDHKTYQTFFVKNHSYDLQTDKCNEYVSTQTIFDYVDDFVLRSHPTKNNPQHYEFNNQLFIKDKIPDRVEELLPEKDINLSTRYQENKKNDKYSTYQNDKYPVYRIQRLHSISLKERESVDNFRIRADLAEEKPQLSSVQRVQGSLENALGEQMITIWQQCIGDPRLSYRSNRLLIDLHAILIQHFESSLYQWQVYCKKIASSKFLMGEGKAWKLEQGVFLLWAIKANNIAKINGNAISLGDRVIPLSSEQSKVIIERFDILQAIKDREDNLATVEHDIHRLRRLAVREDIDALFKQEELGELEVYQEQFEAMIRQGNLTQDPKWIYQACRQYFNPQGWRQMSREGNGRNNPWWYFRIYLTQLFADQHFGQTQQQMIEDKQIQLRQEINQLRNKITKLNYIMEFDTKKMLNYNN